eukprot:8115417-Pyramimonas_sp.AAC.1
MPLCGPPSQSFSSSVAFWLSPQHVGPVSTWRAQWVPTLEQAAFAHHQSPAPGGGGPAERR